MTPVKLDPLRKLVKALLLLRRGLWIRGILKGVAATVEHRRLPAKRHYGTVIDVGANRGQFAIYAFATFKPQQLILFEPNTACGRHLQWVSKTTGAVIHSIALGQKPYTASLFITKKNDSSSLLAPTRAQTQRDIQSRVVARTPVEVTALDSFLLHIKRPCLLKIDVQGYEGEVLLGATETLKRVDDVLVEVSQVTFYQGQKLFPDVDGLLRAAGFDLVQLRPSWTDSEQRWEQADAFYTRRS